MVFSPRVRPSAHLYIERFFRRMGYYPPENFLCFAYALHKYPPEFIHAHFGWDGYFALPLKKVFQVPMITQFYGYDVGTLPRVPLWQRRYRRLFSEGDKFLVEGSFMKSTVAGLGCPPEKIVVHHLGVELDSLPYQPREYAGGPLRVLIAATFTEKKGIEYALRALALVLQEKPAGDWTVTVLGDGYLRDSLHQLAADLGIAQKVTWLGYQPHEVFLAELYKAHLFLSPSVTAQNGDTEGGAPVALIEAQASGLPVISTFHADIPEVVLHNQTGILVPEKDCQLLAAAVVRLLETPSLVTDMGNKGHEHVSRNYNAARQGERLSEIYAQVTTCH